MSDLSKNYRREVSSYRKSNLTPDFENTPEHQLRLKEIASLSEENIENGGLIEVENAFRLSFQLLRLRRS